MAVIRAKIIAESWKAWNVAMLKTHFPKHFWSWYRQRQFMVSPDEVVTRRKVKGVYKTNDNTLRREEEEGSVPRTSWWMPHVKKWGTISSKRHHYSFNFWSSCVWGFKQHFIAQCSDMCFCSRQQRHLARGPADGIQPSHITRCWTVMWKKKSGWKTKKNITDKRRWKCETGKTFCWEI